MFVENRRVMANFNDKGFDNCNKIGKAGESYYKNYVKSRGHDVIDVSDEPIFQQIGVDVIVTRDKNVKFSSTAIDDIKSMMSNKDFSFRKWCVFVDVKADAVAKTSGNCYFEWIAHYMPGCFASTKADKWVYLFWDDETGAPDKMWSIDIKKVRQMIVSGKFKGGQDGVDVYRSKMDALGKDPGMLAWKIPFEKLEKMGLAVVKPL